MPSFSVKAFSTEAFSFNSFDFGVPEEPQAGGGGGFVWPGRRRGKRQTEKLLDQIEATLRETLSGVPLMPEAAKPIDTTKGIERALRQLTLVAEGYTDLSERVARIRREVADYEARQRRLAIERDDEEILLLLE